MRSPSEDPRRPWQGQLCVSVEGTSGRETLGDIRAQMAAKAMSLDGSQRGWVSVERTLLRGLGPGTLHEESREMRRKQHKRQKEPPVNRTATSFGGPSAK